MSGNMNTGPRRQGTVLPGILILLVLSILFVFRVSPQVSNRSAFHEASLVFSKRNSGTATDVKNTGMQEIVSRDILSTLIPRAVDSENPNHGSVKEDQEEDGKRGIIVSSSPIAATGTMAGKRNREPAQQRYSRSADHVPRNKPETTTGHEISQGGKPLPPIGKRLFCEESRRCVDRNGVPCVNLQYWLRSSVIYVVDRPDVKYLTCAIPKNGCSYHLSLVHRIHGEKNYSLLPVIHDSQRKAELKLSARSPMQIAGFLSDNTIPKYVIVRNPLSRLLSAFLDKVLFELPKEVDAVTNFHTWIYDTFPSHRPKNGIWKTVNPHWRRQVEFCGFKRLGVASNFNIFRFEEPDEFIDFLYKTVPEKYLNDGWGPTGSQNSSRSSNFRDFVLGPRKRTRNTDERFWEFFNNLEVFDHVANTFEEDITMFNYGEEVTLMRQTLQRRRATES